MNYRHAFHAGNFADVVKHVILARVLTYMKLKEQPFRVIDTHAGAGCYDLAGTEATRTGEWRDGIGRLIAREAELAPHVRTLLAPYLDAVRAFNPSDDLKIYPGSPLIARYLMRRTDHLIANELHADDAALLKTELNNAPASKVMQLDAFTALRALLPPKERRGVVLIDPPFESREEFSSLGQGLMAARARFATGTYVVWYPVKDRTAADAFLADATAGKGVEFLDVRLAISAPFPGLGLTETGVLVLAPPYTLHTEMALVLPVLQEILEESEGSSHRLLAS